MINLLILWISNFKSRDRHVPATSILETVVSMTILLSILTLSFVALDRINRSLNPAAQYKAHLLTTEVLSRDDLLLDQADEYVMEGYVIKKELIQIGMGTCRVELTVLNGLGKIIYVRKIYKSHEISL